MVIIKVDILKISEISNISKISWYFRLQISWYYHDIYRGHNNWYYLSC